MVVGAELRRLITVRPRALGDGQMGAREGSIDDGGGYHCCW
jgi:hypothetical protein